MSVSVAADQQVARRAGEAGEIAPVRTAARRGARRARARRGAPEDVSTAIAGGYLAFVISPLSAGSSADDADQRLQRRDVAAPAQARR